MHDEGFLLRFAVFDVETPYSLFAFHQRYKDMEEVLFAGQSHVFLGRHSRRHGMAVIHPDDLKLIPRGILVGRQLLIRFEGKMVSPSLYVRNRAVPCNLPLLSEQEATRPDRRILFSMRDYLAYGVAGYSHIV